MINKGIFVEIEICVGEGKVMTTGSEGRSRVSFHYQDSSFLENDQFRV